MVQGSADAVKCPSGGADCFAVTVTAGGTDIWGTSDEFVFVHRELKGDGTVTARFSAWPSADPWAKAGLMIRDSLDPQARHAFAGVSASNGVVFQRRRTAGGATEHSDGSKRTAPVWLRLERSASVMTAYESSDGVSWVVIGTDSIPFAASVQVGVAVTSHNPSAAIRTSATNVEVSMPTLPSGWSNADVGAPFRSGGALFVGGAYAIAGGGLSTSNSDQLHYAFQRIVGDVDVVARVLTAQVQSSGKAGLMIRESLGGDAAQGFMFVSGGDELAFEHRSDKGGPAVRTPAGSGKAPTWLKLERRGTLVSAFRSRDGAKWTLVSREHVQLPAAVLVGFAVTSHEKSGLATGVFSSVTVLPLTTAAANVPPEVSLTSPSASGTSPTVPASVTLAAAASDQDGSVARVDFFAGSTLVASDSAAPYSAIWNATQPGSYTITAVAYDDDGASATSAPVLVTPKGKAAPPANKEPVAVLVWPKSGDTVPLSASTAIAAAAVDLDGSIARVDFYAGKALIGSDTSAPYRVTWKATKAGSYAITAVAHDDRGKSGVSTAAAITVGGAPPPQNVSPVVALTSPTSGDASSLPASMTMSAAASDADGTIARVDFYAGSTLVASDTSSPYSVTWKGTQPGSYALTAVAHDNKGASATSPAVAVTLKAMAGLPNDTPVVFVAWPQAGATFGSLPAAVTIAAAAVDLDGTISRVDFYAGSAIVASDSTAPYSVVWKGTKAGTYALTAAAVDNRGASTTSAPLAVTLGPKGSTQNSPPAVMLTRPASGATLPVLPGSLTIAASASDPDGSIARVDFYAGSTLVGSDSSAPYSMTWKATKAGSYPLTAVAVDSKGASTTSAAVTILAGKTSGSITPGPKTRKLVFEPSLDHASVDSYVMEVSLAGVPWLTIFRQDVGKPAVVNGECTVELMGILKVLLPGSYRVKLKAVNRHGSSPGALSEVFGM